jgi:transposase
LPPQAAYTSGLLLEQLEAVQEMIEALEQPMAAVFKPTAELERLDTLPGVGLILGVVLVLEIGDIQRFRCAERLASYAGTVPRVHASGGKTYYGRTRPDVNHYLKWAYTEAGNVVAVHRERFADRHVSQLYSRIRSRLGHASAIGAAARHLAEATYWMLTKKESYHERGIAEVPPQGL